MISTPSWSLAVMMFKAASSAIKSLASTKRPFTLPAIVALAKPVPIDCATSMTLTGWSNDLIEPSGKVI